MEDSWAEELRDTFNYAWLSLKHAKVKVRHTRLLTICTHLYEALEQANLIYTHRKWLGWD